MSKQVILVGGMGSGRTTIFNKCCNQNFKTFGPHACTKNPVIARSVYGKGFTMIDTPGIGYLQDKINHTCGLAKALSQGEVHQIILTFKYDLISTIEKEMFDFIYKKLYRFKDLITVSVTFFNSCDQQIKVEFEQQIGQLIKKFSLNKVLYVYKEDDGEKICNQIDQILEKVQYGRDCSLQKNELIRFFDLCDVPGDIDDDIPYDIIAILRRANESFQTIFKRINTFIDNLRKANEQRPEVLHCLNLSIAEIANEHLEKFEKIFLDEFDQLEHQEVESIYYFHQDLKKDLSKEVKHLQKKTLNLIYRHSEYVDLIKQCPYCGLVWIKVDKCTDQTYCGEYPEKDDDELFKQSKQPRRFKFYISNGTLQMEENQQAIQQMKNFKQLKPTIGQSGLLGCKQRFIWSELPPLDNDIIEEISSGAFKDCIAKIWIIIIQFKLGALYIIKMTQILKAFQVRKLTKHQKKLKQYNATQHIVENIMRKIMIKSLSQV